MYGLDSNLILSLAITSNSLYDLGISYDELLELLVLLRMLFDFENVRNECLLVKLGED